MKIKWSPVVPREKIRNLYRGESRGLVDATLLEDVGLSLLLRCESILMVSSAQVRCPECGIVFTLAGGEGRRKKDDMHHCPGTDCNWHVTWGEYHTSWTKRRLFGGKALSAFQAYTESYPNARLPGEKMVAIDQLLHAFHWDLIAGAPNRLAADNLIDGNHAQVLQMLEELSGSSAPEWKEVVKRMKKRRQGSDHT